MEQIDNQKKERNWLVIGGAVMAVVFLFICMGVASFAIGRASVSQETITEVVQETITEIVEITREVTVVPELPLESTAENEEAAVDASAQAVEAPAAAETAPEGEEALPEVESEPDEPPFALQVEPPPPVYTDIDDINLDVLYEVWNVVENDFDGQLPGAEELLQALIDGSLDTLDDDYTRYIEPDVAARVREDMGGSVSGIGAFVRPNDDDLVEIVAPIEGQPADLIGLLSGDIVIGVDGQSVIGISFDEVLLRIRGPEGTVVTLEIVREGEENPLTFTITRTRFEVPVTSSEMLPDNIGYIRLEEFNQRATERLVADLTELLAANPVGLIFDLRNNPGGFLNQSISVADLFLPESVVLNERNNQGLDETFSVDSGDLAEEIPLVVLVNGASASASEIVAGAIQDNERGILVGTATFGKGSVQQVYTLSNGAELRVTIARWYTPDDISISDNGITPDIEVEMEPDVDFGGDEDVQLQRAIEYILTGE